MYELSQEILKQNPVAITNSHKDENDASEFSFDNTLYNCNQPIINGTGPVMNGSDEKIIQSVKRNETLTNTHSSTSMSLNLSEDEEEDDEYDDDDDHGCTKSENDTQSQKDKQLDIVVYNNAQSSLNMRFSDKNESSLDNIEQQVALLVENASRASGQLREFWAWLKVLEREFGHILPRVKKSVLEALKDITIPGSESENDQKFLVGSENEGVMACSVVNMLQRNKSNKRKLRKWRKSARIAMNEICPNSKSACFFEMTPGVLKEAVQEVRNLRGANNTLQCNNDIMSKSVSIQQIELDKLRRENAELKTMIQQLLSCSTGIRITNNELFEICDGVKKNAVTNGKKKDFKTHTSSAYNLDSFKFLNENMEVTIIPPILFKNEQNQIVTKEEILKRLNTLGQSNANNKFHNITNNNEYKLKKNKEEKQSEPNLEHSTIEEEGYNDDKESWEETEGLPTISPLNMEFNNRNVEEPCKYNYKGAKSNRNGGWMGISIISTATSITLAFLLFHKKKQK